MNDNEWNYLGIFERILKLCVPNLILWLLIFYSFFHSFLNLLAEILRFADRDFYGEWYNSMNMREFWASWNRPVHHFALRHIYSPVLRNLHVKKEVAQIIVFFLSAVAHELLVSIPAHQFKIYAFIAMLLQAPLIIMGYILEKILGDSNKTLGNIIFWISFCIFGQPCLILLYYHDLMKSN